MNPHLPIKRFCLGLETMSLADRTKWFEFCHPASFDTHDEAFNFIHANPGWSGGNHPHSGIVEMSDEDLAFYNNHYAQILSGQPDEVPVPEDE